MKKKLYRSRSDKMLGGVAGGLGEYIEIDPVFVRLIWALLILSGGVGIVLYIVAWIIIPEEPKKSNHKEKETNEK